MGSNFSKQSNHKKICFLYSDAVSDRRKPSSFSGYRHNFMNLSILELNDQVLGKIVSYLDGLSLLTVLLTCKQLNKVASDPYNWGVSVLFVYVKHLAIAGLVIAEKEIFGIVEKLRIIKHRYDPITEENVSYVLKNYGSIMASVFCMTTSTSINWSTLGAGCFANVSVTLQPPNRTTTVKIDCNVNVNEENALTVSELTTTLAHYSHEKSACDGVGSYSVLVSTKSVVKMLHRELGTEHEVASDLLEKLIEIIYNFYHHRARDQNVFDCSQTQAERKQEMKSKRLQKDHEHELREWKGDLKGELQRQNKLISSERPFKILQNETKIIKIG